MPDAVEWLRDVVELLLDLMQSLPDVGQALPDALALLPFVGWRLPCVVQGVPGIGQGLLDVAQALPGVVQGLPGVVERVLDVGGQLPGARPWPSGLMQVLPAGMDRLLHRLVFSAAMPCGVMSHANRPPRISKLHKMAAMIGRNMKDVYVNSAAEKIFSCAVPVSPAPV